MYFPYLRGRQFELIALRELAEEDCINEKVIPIIEPIKPSSTLLKTLQVFAEKDKEIAVVFNPTVGAFSKEIKEMRAEDSKVANELYELLLNNDKIIKAYVMNKARSKRLKTDVNKEKYMIINLTRDSLDNFLEVYDGTLPRYTLIPEGSVK